MTTAQATTPAALLEGIAAGLAARIRDVAAAQQRAGSFVRGPIVESGADQPERAAGDPGAASRDLILRVCRAIGVAANAELLASLAHGDASDAALAEDTDVDPLVMWERVNELIQVGLARRDLSTGRVGLTASGAGIATVLDDLVRAVDRLRSVPTPLGLAGTARGPG